MKALILTVFLACGSVSLFAQKPAWQPSPGHTQAPLWPGGAPDADFGPPANTETAEAAKSPVAGRPWLAVESVSRPTMTVYSPKGKNTGAAVVVFPGGGYQDLAIDLEGTEVCDWLTSKGITCVLLKYRVPHSGPQYDEKCKCQVNPKAPMALQDAQRTMGLVRFHAAEYHIDPHRIGVLGFSAGGHWWPISARTSTNVRIRPSMPPTKKAAARISLWLFIRDISGLGPRSLT
jgi:acetyl esterase/lipase